MERRRSGETGLDVGVIGLGTEHPEQTRETMEVGFSQWDGVTDWLRKWYAALPAPTWACIVCGVCGERCPFDVEVRVRMRQAEELFEAA